MISKMLLSLVTYTKTCIGILTDESPNQYLIVTLEGVMLCISGLFHTVVLLLFFPVIQTNTNL